MENPGDYLARNELENVRKVDQKTGKVFQDFHVPPTLLNFLDHGGSGDDDPFATDEPEEVGKESLRPLLRRWDSRVVARPGDRVIDMRPLLKLQGVL